MEESQKLLDNTKTEGIIISKETKYERKEYRHRHFSPWQIDGDDKNIKALENGTLAQLVRAGNS